ncbi:MAG: DUF2125 domain-containing protein [Rhizobiaceae bacterium]
MRAILIFLAVAVLAAIGWVAGWNYLARQIDDTLSAQIAGLNDRGLEVACAERALSGFPFRLSLGCKSTGLFLVRDGVDMQAGAFRSAAQFYNPGHAVFELDGPADIRQIGGDQVQANWTNFRGSIRAGLNGLARLSVQSRSLSLGYSGQGTNAPPLLADLLEFHVMPVSQDGKEGDLAVAVTATGLKIEISTLPQIPLLDGAGDVALDGGERLLAAGPALMREIRARGVSGNIRNLRLSAETGANLTASGPFSVGTDGKLSAELQLEAGKLGLLAQVVRQSSLDTGLSETLASALELLFPDSAPDNKKIVINIDKGMIRAGFIPLGELAPLF